MDPPPKERELLPMLEPPNERIGELWIDVRPPLREGLIDGPKLRDRELGENDRGELSRERDTGARNSRPVPLLRRLESSAPKFSPRPPLRERRSLPLRGAMDRDSGRPR